MSGHELVRPSRDGDQFHYYWAARHCLELLPGGGDLSAVAIEGASVAEAPGPGVEEGQQLIDVALYYGSEVLTAARLVRYVQLKHSTRHPNEAWTASGLGKTIRGFAQRYVELVKQFSASSVLQRFRFEFTTNRPIAVTLQEAIADLAAGAQPRHLSLQQTLVEYTLLDLATAQQFFSIFKAEGSSGDLWTERNLLSLNLGSYLPGEDGEAPLQLKELVTRKATSEHATNPSIRRYDVLRALKVSEATLQPAPCQIRDAAASVPREQEDEIRASLASASGPVVIHADGGVGKSVLAVRLTSQVATSSVAILYDCFGDGLYRTSLHSRHRHQDALVQIANELSARGLCHPLIPTSHADAKQYMGAFLNRIDQAVILLRTRDPQALLYLVIDAADNAEMAAHERQEPASFVRDLIRAPLRDGVKLVFTCRTHRRDLLKAPVNTHQIDLRPFTESETARHLHSAYPAATKQEVDEFHTLSSANPRVQALALSRGLALPDMLMQLGPTPTTVERAIGELLEHAVERMRDQAGPVEVSQIEMICRALAVLRPLIPISVLARLSDTSESAIRSFALDFGRPLFVKGDTLHFFDEPAETWFRERFRPEAQEMIKFLDKLRPLASTSSYVASVLPHLLLETGHLDELIALALSGTGLPNENPLSRRDVELQRMSFALKACLQQHRYLPAAKLALKAGGEFAGEDRLNRVIQENTDLAALLLTPDRLEEIVSRRAFGSSWMGSHHAYEAGLLSGREELSATASSRLRMALDWLYTWARLPPEERENETVSDDDRAELALAILRLRGANEAAKFLKRWRPHRIAFQASRLVARRLIDLGDYEQLETITNAAGHNTWFLLGVALEARRVRYALPADPLRRLLQRLGDRRIKLEEYEDYTNRWHILFAVTAAIEIALNVLPRVDEVWANILRRYLPSSPPRELADRFGYADRAALVRSYVLEAALRSKPITLMDLAPSDVRKHLDAQRQYVYDREAAVFKREIGSLLPWSILACEIACGRVPQPLSTLIELTRKQYVSSKGTDQDSFRLSMDVALEWFQILRITGTAADVDRTNFMEWLRQQHVGANTYAALCRVASRADGFEALALQFAASGFEALEGVREDAESLAHSYVDLARAIFLVSPEESNIYFDRAVEISNRIGDENLERWAALLHLAQAAGERGAGKPVAAYRLSRMAELTYQYVARDKHFEWERTVEALADLCAPSSFAILSRWRDRRFGESTRLLPVLVYRLIDQGKLPASTPLVFAGFKAQWRRLNDMERFCREESDPGQRRRVAEIAYRYMRVQFGGHEEFSSLKQLSERFGFHFPDIDRLVNAGQPAKARATERSDTSLAEPRADGKTPDWHALFDGVDMTDSDALLAAHNAVRTFDPPWDFETFFEQAFARVKVGREPEFIRAVMRWPDFDIYDVRNLLKAQPPSTSKQLSVRRAIRDAVLEACRREPERVRRHGYYTIVPFEQLDHDSIVSEQDVVQATLSGYAANIDSLGSSSLFHLVDPLAASLTPAEADEALHFGLDLLEDILQPEDGDGTWRSDLSPSTDLMSAMAGYVWAGLGAPEVAVRWESAHTVRNAVETNWAELLHAFIPHATSAVAGCFVDSGLCFYDWHARQWLLIGLARGALQNGQALRPFVPLLQAWIRYEHVLLRELSTTCLCVCVASGLMEQSELDALIQLVTTTPREVTVDGWTDRVDTIEGADPPSDDEQFHFSLDIGPYWFKPLASCFGVTQRALEGLARTLIKCQMGLATDDDARYARKIFEDGETRHSHGSSPATDDLTAYAAYHAMMFAAAHLLKRFPVHRRADELKNEYEQWFQDFQLTRPDGKWISDRRDPRLVTEPPSGNGYNDREWRWQVTAAQLDNALITDDGLTALWGAWDSGDERHKESISVRSALVPLAVAEPLLAALQTAPELDRLYLPDASDRPRVKSGNFKLTGYVNDYSASHCLDEGDPWSEGLHFPSPSPSSSCITALSLSELSDGRSWTVGPALIRSETWTRQHGIGRDSAISPGSRLSANKAMLEHFFATMPDKCLVISVAIRRRSGDSRDTEDEFGSYYVPYTRYYLIRKDCVAHVL